MVGNDVEKQQFCSPGEDSITLVARHAVAELEVKVVLPKNATFLDAKQAIAKQVDCDDIATKGRLVRKKGGVFQAYRDADYIGDVRQVLVLGGELKTHDSAADSDGKEEQSPTLYSNASLEGGSDAKMEPPSAHHGREMGKDSMGAEEPAPAFTKQRAIDMQRELLHGFSNVEFQRKLRNLQFTCEPDSEEYFKERNHLFLSVQSTVLPKFGFQGNHRGVLDMMHAIKPFQEDAQFLRNNIEINNLLGIEPPPPPKPKPPEPKPALSSTIAATAKAARPKTVTTKPPPKPAPPPPPPPPEEIEILIKHAIKEGTGVQVKVCVNWTYKQVKEALAKKLGNDSVRKNAKLVFSKGSGWNTTWGFYQDTEEVGKPKELLLLAADLPAL